MENEKRPRILIVDDDERWLKKLHRILHANYDLTLITEPSKALESLNQTSYALVILDMRFPGAISGLDLFSHMQKVVPALQAIILTGYPDASSMRSSFKKGFLDYLEKTAGKDELKAMVEEALERSNNFKIDIPSLITEGESEVLEFKASARWDVRANKHNKEMENAVVKTVAAFLNSAKGGTLLLGVDDNGTVVGLEPDFHTLGRKNVRDEFENSLTNLLLNGCGKECSPLIHIFFHLLEDKDICRIAVKPSPKPVFVTDERGGENLFIRTGNSTRLLTARETVEYCKIRW
jgi:ActR/RegA family two-component response regulator